MRALKFFILFVLTSCLLSCNSEQKKLQKLIETTEAVTDKTNVESAIALAKLYEEFANKFKKDEKAPVYLIEASKLYVDIGNYNKSIELLDYVIGRYPDSKTAAEALFLKAFVYENNLNDISRAKAAYEEFLRLYPNHEMAASVKQNMPTIGKDVMPDVVKEAETNDINEQENLN
jgi:TolA-binding protein